MEILNIDAFAEVTRKLRFQGKDYPVLELELQAFIDNLKAAKEVEAAGNSTDPLLNLEFAIKSVAQAIPEMPVELIRKMNMVQLGKVLNYIRGEHDAEALMKAAAEVEAAEGTEGPKEQAT